MNSGFQNVGKTLPGVAILAHDHRPATYDVGPLIFAEERARPGDPLWNGKKSSLFHGKQNILGNVESRAAFPLKGKQLER